MISIAQKLGLQGVTDIGNSTTNGMAIASDSNGFSYGSTGQAKIYYNGTDLIIDPSVSGSGSINTNGKNFIGNSMALAGDSLNSGRVINMSATGTVFSGGIVCTLNYSGATSIMRAMLFESQHAGSATNPSGIGGGFTATLDADSSGTSTMYGVLATAKLLAGRKVTQGIKILKNEFVVSGDAGGHTGGTINAYSGLFRNPTNFAGGVTLNRWAINSLGDVQITSDQKLILEGSETVKGDSYFTFNSTRKQIEMYVNNMGGGLPGIGRSLSIANGEALP